MHRLREVYEMKRYLILLLLLLTTQAHAFNLWDSASLFGGSSNLLPGASSQTAFLSFNETVGAGTFSRASNAWNPATGLIAPHNLTRYSMSKAYTPNYILMD